MSKWLLGVCAAVIGGALVMNDVEAKRLGGGRSSGIQRNVTPPPARPAQQQAAPQQGGPAQQAVPAQQAAPAAAAAAPARSGLSRWMPMLGGLALGGMLGYLFGGSGMMGILLVLLLVVGVVFAIRAFARRRTQEAPQPMQYAGMGQETVVAPPPSQSAGLPPQVPASRAGNVPAGFDSASFLRGAKLNFIKLQAANDAGQLDELRELATNEMFEQLKADMAERGGASQQTDIVNLDADLLEVATEGDKHLASISFSGMARDTPGGTPAPFQEIWHLAKPADGSTGWLLAGIQQVQ
jgi:predicted lipid-binding transport protein (Tim44 family)